MNDGGLPLLEPGLVPFYFDDDDDDGLQFVGSQG